MTMPVERFLSALDRYIELVVVDTTQPGPLTRNNRLVAKNTVINELRLLLTSAQEDSRTAAQKAAAWRTK